MAYIYRWVYVGRMKKKKGGERKKLQAGIAMEKMDSKKG